MRVIVRELLSHYDNDPAHNTDWMKRLSAIFTVAYYSENPAALTAAKRRVSYGLHRVRSG
jgi:hypothetical protein